MKKERGYHDAQNERQQKPSKNQYHQRLRIPDRREEQSVIQNLTAEVEAIQKDIEEKKADLKAKKSELKSAKKELAKLEAKKAKAEHKVAEEAKK